MAYINFKPSDYFATKTYTGNGSTNVIVNNVDSDLVWCKKRDGASNNQVFDSVRGVYKYLVTNGNHLENTAYTNNLTAFNSNGFTLGADGSSDINGNGGSFVSWAWRAGTTSGISGGTITPSSYSINTTSGFGIYKYIGTGANGTIAHGLSSAPELVIVKKTSAIEEWVVGGTMLTSGAYKIVLNTSAAQLSEANAFNSTLPSSTVVSLGTSGGTNTSTGGYIMYAFAPVKGFSKFGTYTGNGNADGTFVYTGFAPAKIIQKNTAGSENWHSYDNKRNTFNVRDKTLDPDQTSAESTLSGIDFLSNGFKIRTTATWGNGSGANYIYMAWAENPIIGSGGTVGVAI